MYLILLRDDLYRQMGDMCPFSVAGVFDVQLSCLDSDGR